MTATETEEYHLAAGHDQQGRPDGFSVNLYGTDGHLRKLREIEAEVIRVAVVMYGGRPSEIARHLHVGRSTIYRKLDELGIKA